MKILLSIIFIYIFSFGNIVEEKIWKNGWSLLTFFEKYNIDKSIYFSLDKNDKEVCSELYANTKYYIVFDDNKEKLKQALIPVSDELQIHIYRENNSYKLELIPIIYKTITTIAKIRIKTSPYLDILRQTGNKSLANEFVKNFKKLFNFKKLHKQDTIYIKYVQKIRLGRYFSTPTIIATIIKTKRKIKYIFQNQKDGKYYDNKGRSLTSVYFVVPIRYKRISDKFTYKRFHPILHRYIAHLGIDYAAPYGRKIWASGDGKIIFKGRKGGYGNAIIIRHSNGYKSLYAHLSRYARIRVGQYVKQGKVIGFVGSTGRSTGPHLHFGIYKNGKAINPQKVLGSSKKSLYGKEKKRFLSFVRKTKKELLSFDSYNFKLDKFVAYCEVKDEKRDK